VRITSDITGWRGLIAPVRVDGLGCRVPIALEANFIRLPKPEALGYEFLADYLTLPASVAPGTSANLPVATSYIYP